MKKILFANIGWMIHYEGNTSIDTIQGGGSYPASSKLETFLFQSIDGVDYGYVQPGGNSNKSHTIKLERIDPNAKGKDYLTGVLVVWTACRPNAGGTVIVGWYKNATVYRTPQSGNKKGRIYDYNIKADSKDCRLLYDIQRTFHIKRREKGYMGQSNVWYADTDNSEITKFRKKVIKYVNSRNQPMGRLDLTVQYRMATTTVKAIDIVAGRYKALGYEVKSARETEYGWSMRATYGKIKLHIDVRERSSEEHTLHITADELSRMNAKSNQSYRMCVVTENADSTQEISTFLLDRQSWVCDEDVKKRMSVHNKEVTITQI